MPKEKPENPIIEEYRGRKIRQHPIVYLRVSIPEMKRFIDAQVDSGLSAMQAIREKKLLCIECKDPHFKKFTQ